jgi:hypothetical protein
MRLQFALTHLPGRRAAAALAAVLAAAVATHGVSGFSQEDPRAALDQVQKLSSELKYKEAMAMFERVKADQPNAITSLDGLKMAVVYAEAGEAAKHEALTRWLLDRYRTPPTPADAERCVKGYIVYRGAKNSVLLAEAVKMTVYASDHAAAEGDGQYQGFFDTSRAIAQFRVRNFAEAARFFPKTITHDSPLVRSLALPFYAMTELALGNRQHAEALYAQAQKAVEELPKPGTYAFQVDWTDILISRGAFQEAKAAFGR